MTIMGKTIIDFIIPAEQAKENRPSKRAKNYIWQQFGRLTVIGEIPRNRRKSKNKRELVCLCECGKVITVSKTNLLSGNTLSCGCLAKELQHQKALNNYIGVRFGRLTGVREADDSILGKLRILCLCDCGEYKSVSALDLSSGMVRSCGCLRVETSKLRNTEDLTGQTFNELTAIKQVENFVGANGKERVQWLWQCTCGEQIVALVVNVKHGKTKSCGHLTKSYAEQKIKEHLEKLNISFRYDKAIDKNLKREGVNHPLRFDFIIDKPDGSVILIEHQGQQHFQKRKDYECFGDVQREITDKMKKDYCKLNNIPLYETMFNENYIKHIDAILLENGFSIDAA